MRSLNKQNRKYNYWHLEGPLDFSEVKTDPSHSKKLGKSDLGNRVEIPDQEEIV